MEAEKDTWKNLEPEEEALKDQEPEGVMKDLEPEGVPKDLELERVLKDLRTMCYKGAGKRYGRSGNGPMELAGNGPS